MLNQSKYTIIPNSNINIFNDIYNILCWANVRKNSTFGGGWWLADMIIFYEILEPTPA